ncbi:hypothetical protein K470DRAFT_261201 [Piedraia hortae CBS 480.64]|uniref:Mid2 domain-containing protein n=1 Tax=Piedraia hortae CBS 480.64 TaxID=1314780 RepID=A0A6A7CAP1_9PEZI|nr:hypothetical protein K470DRAFT_261201 [Piedraia hortae CBS 480.64]
MDDAFSILASAYSEDVSPSGNALSVLLSAVPSNVASSFESEWGHSKTIAPATATSSMSQAWQSTSSPTPTSSSSSAQSTTSAPSTTSPASTQPPTSTPTHASNKGSMHEASIAGIATGVTAAVVILLLLALFCWRRRMKHRDRRTSTNETQDSITSGPIFPHGGLRSSKEKRNSQQTVLGVVEPNSPTTRLISPQRRSGPPLITPPTMGPDWPLIRPESTLYGGGNDSPAVDSPIYASSPVYSTHSPIFGGSIPARHSPSPILQPMNFSRSYSPLDRGRSASPGGTNTPSPGPLSGPNRWRTSNSHSASRPMSAIDEEEQPRWYGGPQRSWENTVRIIGPGGTVMNGVSNGGVGNGMPNGPGQPMQGIIGPRPYRPARTPSLNNSLLMMPQGGVQGIVAQHQQQQLMQQQYMQQQMLRSQYQHQQQQ